MGKVKTTISNDILINDIWRKATQQTKEEIEKVIYWSWRKGIWK